MLDSKFDSHTQPDKESWKRENWKVRWREVLEALDLPQEFLGVLYEDCLHFEPRIQKTQGLENYGAFDILREDENGGLISGPKVRKWHGILAWCKTQHIEKVHMRGGTSSANLLLGALRLTEAGIPFSWIRPTRQSAPRPMEPSQTPHSSVHPSVHQETPKRKRILSPVANLLSAFAPFQMSEDEALSEALSQKSSQKLLELEEGCPHPAAFAGCLSLAAQIASIICTEQNTGNPYTDLLIDSGSGVTAQALITGLGLLGQIQLRVHVAHIAGTPEKFESSLNHWQKNVISPKNRCPLPARFHHTPPHSQSFGSVTRRVKEDAARWTLVLGQIVDPIYMAKTLEITGSILENIALKTSTESLKNTDSHLQGRLLVLQSGGALNALGFI